MVVLVRQLLILAVALGFSASSWSYDLRGKWDLMVKDKCHHVVATLIVEFTSQYAESCIGGKWKRVTVVSAATEDKHFFPSSDPLSFKIENNELTIGRSEVCDAYLMLSGTFDRDTVSGEYYSLGLGGTSPLGFFTLSRKRSAQ